MSDPVMVFPGSLHWLSARVSQKKKKVTVTDSVGGRRWGLQIMSHELKVGWEGESFMAQELGPFHSPKRSSFSRS